MMTANANARHGRWPRVLSSLASLGLVLGCDGEAPHAGEPAHALQSAQTSGEPILQGPPGPAGDSSQPTRAEVAALASEYGEMLTFSEAEAVFLRASELPTAGQLAALATAAQIAAFASEAVARDWADAELVPRAEFPAVDTLLPTDEAEAIYAPASAAEALAAYATQSDLPAPGFHLEIEVAEALYEPASALEGLASQAIASSLQPREGQLRPTLAEAVRQRIRERRHQRACPEGMAPVADFCVDIYEASVWTEPHCQGEQFGLLGGAAAYPPTFPPSGAVTQPAHRLYACSAPGHVPSRFITWFQASQACAAAGKRLCANAEWQLAAIGTPDSAEACTFGEGPIPVITPGEVDGPCVSDFGIQDAIGNAAEWVADWTVGHYSEGPKWISAEDYETDTWPPSLAEVDDLVAGIGSTVRLSATLVATGLPAAMVRGGSWADGVGPAGAYSTSWEWSVTAATSDIGFRCCAARF